MSVLGAPPSFATLERLARSADIRDRAFVASALSLGRHHPAETAGLHARIREAATNHHAGIRARIRDGALDAKAFLAHLEDHPLDVRDHMVEEILDIAYPPQEQTSLPREAIPYCPSGLAEIVFMLSHADLGPGKTFVDLGAGLGKVVLLVAMLTGARAVGIELDPLLVLEARSAARSLNLDHACFLEGDIRDVQLPPTDVYYMYIPLIHSRAVVERLTASSRERRALLFAQPLDLTNLPGWRATGKASYWLEMYEGLSPQDG
jgi:SAM-dependent methyltransferase